MRRRGGHERSLAAACFAFVAALASHARAETLTYDAPAGCPSAEAMHTALDEARATIGPDAVLASDVDVTITHARSHYVARITSADGTRALEARRCESLVAAVAVVLANTMVLSAPRLPAPAGLDAPSPSAAAAPSPSGPVDDARTAVTPDTSSLGEATAEDEPAPDDERSDSLRAVFSSTTEFVHGSTLDVGVGQSMGLRTDGFEVSLRWAYAGGVELPAELSLATLRIGWLARHEDLEASFRMVGLVGVVWPGTNMLETAIFGAVGAGLEGRLWVTSWLAAALGVELAVPVSPTTRALDGSATVALPSTMLSGSLGLVMQTE